MVVKKDPKLPQHPELKGIPNLHVMMALRSLKSLNYVTETFNWQHHYYVLTPEGIEYLRDVLHLPSSVQPDTYTRKTRAPVSQGLGAGRRGGEEGGAPWGDRLRGRGRREFGGSTFGRDQGYTGGMA